jgi:hypothetical protein
MLIRCRRILGATLLAAAVFAFPVHAQLPPAVSELNVPAVLPPTVEGDWNRTDTHGSGSYGGLLSGYTQATLKPEYAAMVRAGRGSRGGQGPGRGGLEYDSEGFGYRLADTHFIERFIPSADGKHLTLRFEYNDPRIYEKPHVYEFTLDRMTAGSYALDEFCDATDPLEGQSIVPPQQQ